VSEADGVEIRDFAPACDADGLADLFARVFGTPRGGQTLEWLFRPGPAGASPRTVAVADGRIVGHAGATALRFRIAGAEVRGGYSVAAMTDPAMRGRRLFFRMGEHLYRRMEELGFAFVAGFSNRNSFRLMTGPLQRTAIRPFPWCVRPLAPLGLVRALAGAPAHAPAPDDAAAEAIAGATRPGVQIAFCAPDDERLDAIWLRAAEAVVIGAVRDAAFCAWRYGTRPDAGYRLMLAEQAGAPAGWLAYRSMSVRGIRAGFVMDLVLAPGAEPAGRALLSGAASLARAEGATLLSALRPQQGAAARAFRRAGFVRVPEPLHPQLIRFSIRGLGACAGRTAELARARDWQLGWSDVDIA
jgi:GNAT superfamily N-acetyltransferase